MAGNFITELLGYVGLETDDASFKNAEKQLGKVTGSFRDLIALAGTVKAAMTGVGFALVNDFANSAMEIDKISTQIGTSTEEMQRMTYAFGQFGLTADDVFESMKELQIRTEEFVATGKGGGSEFFERLGFTQAGLKGLTNDAGALFDTVLDKLATIEDQAVLQRAVDELYGGTGGEKMPLIIKELESYKQAKKEAELTIIPDEQIQAGKEFFRDLKAITGIVGALKNRLVAGLIPSMSKLLKTSKEWLVANSDRIVNGITKAFEVLGDTLRYVMYAAAALLPYFVGVYAMQMYNGVIALVGAMRALRVASLAAWSAAALGPIAVGVVILGIIAIVEDLYQAVNGGESVFKNAFNNIKNDLFAWGHSVDAWFKNLWDRMIEAVIGFAVKVKDEIAGMLPDWMIKWLQDGKANLTVETAPQSGFSELNAAGGYGNVGGLGLVNNAPNPSNVSNNKNIVVNNNVKPDVKIDVHSSDPVAAGEQVASKFAEGMADTYRTLNNGMNY
ncbi:tail tape measure protein [Yersinia phage vB_YenM_534]|nr:tail tape measure protein [Yersinia phage vB_YenM_534]